ncbi:MAG: hypothetical protein ACOC6K_01495, partial [Thermodesulfobacteriota bacterium]
MIFKEFEFPLIMKSYQNFTMDLDNFCFWQDNLLSIYFSFHPNFFANWRISMLGGGGMTCGLPFPASALFFSQICAIMPPTRQLGYTLSTVAGGGGKFHLVRQGTI